MAPIRLRESHAQGTWQELRDERGKLYARLEVYSLRLEIKSTHDVIATFDLRDYLDFLIALESQDDLR